MFIIIIEVLIILTGYLLFLSRRYRQIGLIYLIAYYAFGNIFLSCFSPLIEDRTLFLIVQGGPFVLTSLIGAHAVIFGWRRLSPFNFLAGASILLLLAYFIFGIATNGFVEASIYLRLFISPILLLVIGLYFQSLGQRTVVLRSLYSVGLFAGILIFVESLAPTYYYEFLSAESFFSLKEERPGLTVEALAQDRVRRFFNVSFFEHIQVFKPIGPTFHYPSSSYLLIYAIAAACMLKRRYSAILMLFPLMLLSTKASLVMLVFLAIGILPSRFRPPAGMVLAISGLVGVLAVLVMELTQNVHSHSLISSILNASNNLLGRGLGFGGSITAEASNTWQYDMLVGDSGLAVILNMLGLPGLILYFVYYRIAGNFLIVGRAAASDSGLFLTGALLAGCIANSILQELAVGPYAMGLAMLIGGSLWPSEPQPRTNRLLRSKWGSRWLVRQTPHPADA